MTKYEWKLKSLAKGIDPDTAIKEIERIENVYGSLNAENILEASRSRKSVLHALFQWDDGIAATNYRLQQARTILNNIEVRIISNGEERTIPVFEIVNLGEDRCYKSIQTMDSNDIDFVKARTKREIVYLRNKLTAYQAMEATILHLDKAIESI